MTNMRCANCGTELPPNARFCRLCGQPQAFRAGESVTEDTTRRLDQPTLNGVRANGATISDPFAPRNYAPPNAPPHPATAHIGATPMTQGLNAQCRRRRLKWLGAIFALILLLGAVTPFALYFLMPRKTFIKKSVVKMPSIPPVPQAPSAPNASANSNFDNLIYPNSTVAQKIVHDGDKTVLRLESGDDFDKIVQWYEQKLKPDDKVFNNGRFSFGKNAVLKGDEATVVISGVTDKIQIIITSED
jgi:hypothetical protein